MKKNNFKIVFHEDHNLRYFKYQEDGWNRSILINTEEQIAKVIQDIYLGEIKLSESDKTLALKELRELK